MVTESSAITVQPYSRLIDGMVFTFVEETLPRVYKGGSWGGVFTYYRGEVLREDYDRSCLYPPVESSVEVIELIGRLSAPMPWWRGPRYRAELAILEALMSGFPEPLMPESVYYGIRDRPRLVRWQFRAINSLVMQGAVTTATIDHRCSPSLKGYAITGRGLRRVLEQSSRTL